MDSDPEEVKAVTKKIVTEEESTVVPTEQLNAMKPFEFREPSVESKPISSLLAQNSYSAKKTVAQGMMDIALITANANQLRYLFEFNRDSPTFELNVALIIISLLVQMAVGVALIFKGRFDLDGETKRVHANRMNNYVVVGIFIVTVINVFVSAFSIMASPPDAAAANLITSPPASALLGALAPPTAAEAATAAAAA